MIRDGDILVPEHLRCGGHFLQRRPAVRFFRVHVNIAANITSVGIRSSPSRSAVAVESTTSVKRIVASTRSPGVSGAIANPRMPAKSNDTYGSSLVTHAS
jgi:hypothetical protein